MRVVREARGPSHCANYDELRKAGVQPAAQSRRRAGRVPGRDHMNLATLRLPDNGGGGEGFIEGHRRDHRVRRHRLARPLVKQVGDDRSPAHRPRGRRPARRQRRDVLRWTRRGELPAIRLPGGAIRFREDERRGVARGAGDDHDEECSATREAAAQRVGYRVLSHPEDEED